VSDVVAALLEFVAVPNLQRRNQSTSGSQETLTKNLSPVKEPVREAFYCKPI
jgi:hypothetical protein